jgi:hypothetical protein
MPLTCHRLRVQHSDIVAILVSRSPPTYGSEVGVGGPTNRSSRKSLPPNRRTLGSGSLPFDTERVKLRENAKGEYDKAQKTLVVELR